MIRLALGVMIVGGLALFAYGMLKVDDPYYVGRGLAQRRLSIRLRIYRWVGSLTSVISLVALIFN